ncbi:hypothetical protein OK016_24825 [Vibrio chagasii]|nr:hypothetical protein [Vibrio chagasii]
MEARGQISEQWDISIGYSFLDATKTKRQARSRTTCPDHLFSLWSTYQLDDNWRLGGGVVCRRYAGNDETVTVEITHG